jgi:hypothetical protein
MLYVYVYPSLGGELFEHPIFPFRLRVKKLDACVISDFVKGQPNVLTRLKYEQPDKIA